MVVDGGARASCRELVAGGCNLGRGAFPRGIWPPVLRCHSSSSPPRAPSASAVRDPSKSQAHAGAATRVPDLAGQSLAAGALLTAPTS